MVVIKLILQSLAGVGVCATVVSGGVVAIKQQSKKENIERKNLEVSKPITPLKAEEQAVIKNPEVIIPNTSTPMIPLIPSIKKTVPPVLKEPAKEVHTIPLVDKASEITPKIIPPTETIEDLLEDVAAESQIIDHSKYIFVITTSSEHNDQPTEEIVSTLKTKNYQCEWTDIISPNKESSDCFVYNVQTSSERLQNKINKDNENLLQTKEDLKTSKKFLLAIEKEKYKNKLSSTQISLVNKTNNKKYAVLSELTHSSKTFYAIANDSVEPTSFLWKTIENNEFVVSLREKKITTNTPLINGFCQIVGQEKEWACEIIKSSSEITLPKSELTLEEISKLSKATNSSELTQSSNYLIFSSSTARHSKTEIAASTINFFLKSDSAEKTEIATFKYEGFLKPAVEK